jgi:hypothetical protein
MALMLQVVKEVFEGYGYDTWITSANDGAHKSDSFHYADAAMDFRINHVLPVDRELIHKALTSRLEPQFDVLWEYQYMPNEHIHVEYDPK